MARGGSGCKIPDTRRLKVRKKGQEMNSVKKKAKALERHEKKSHIKMEKKSRWLSQRKKLLPKKTGQKLYT